MKGHIMCENCGIREATVYIKKNINGVIKEQYLCPHCASLLGNQPFEDEFFGGSFLSSFVHNKTKSEKPKVCKCGMTSQELAKNGKFGCADCYQVFGDIADNYVEQLGGKVYANKTASESNDPICNTEKQPKNKKTKLQTLQEQLLEAVKNEDYLLANELKNKIEKTHKGGADGKIE